VSIFNRVTTWVTNQLLTSSALNGEFNNLVNTLNNLDSASTSWTNIKTTTLTPTTVNTNIVFDSTSSHGIQGTITNDSAAAGNVGELQDSIISSAISATANTAANVTSISLTAGDWRVLGSVAYSGANASFVLNGAISANSASFTGTVVGYSKAQGWVGTVTAASVFCMREMQLTTTTTVYLVFEVPNSEANVITGAITARRMR
jgi:hypothetical protein